MQLTLRGDLPLVTATFVYRGATVEIPNMLVDTGATSTIVNADIAGEVGVYCESTDRMRTLRGVGGREIVFARHIDRLAVGDHGLDDFEVELGEMDYGFELGGILGMDFLHPTAAIVDLAEMTIDFSGHRSWQRIGERTPRLRL